MFYLKFILILAVFFSASCSQKIQKTGLSSVKINEIKIEEGITTKSSLIKNIDENIRLIKKITFSNFIKNF